MQNKYEGDVDELLGDVKVKYCEARSWKHIANVIVFSTKSELL